VLLSHVFYNRCDTFTDFSVSFRFIIIIIIIIIELQVDFVHYLIEI
jgi:hypothetical protein